MNARFALVVALSFAASAASAQRKAAADSVKDCEKASKTVEHGQPKHKLSDALVTLLRCGPRAATLFATAIDESRSEADSGALSAFYATANEWRDAGMMRAAIRVAGDRTATTPARVFATTHLLRLLTPGARYSYTLILQRSAAGNRQRLPACIPFAATTHGEARANGEPLPSNYEDLLATELFRIAEDASAPPAVRYAATCSGKLPP